jgi:hypothetical protein
MESASPRPSGGAAIAAEPIQIDLNGALQTAQAEYGDAREEFLAATATDTAPLEAQALARTEPFYDPANNRDPLLQEPARRLVADVSAFSDLRASLVETAPWAWASALTAWNGAAVASVGAAVETVGDLAQIQVIPGNLQSAKDGADRIYASLDAGKRKTWAVVARGVAVVSRTAKATYATASLVETRRAELEAYLGEFADVDLGAALRLADKAAAVEVGWLFAEQFLHRGAEALFNSVPFVPVITAAVRGAYGFKAELAALKTNYGRTLDDEMLSFSRRAAAGNQQAGDLLQLLTGLAG